MNIGVIISLSTRRKLDLSDIALIQETAENRRLDPSAVAKKNGGNHFMKKTKRIIAYIMAVVVALSCSGLAAVVSASAASTITDVKIVSYPTKTVFVQGTDWDYGYYDMPESYGLGTFVEKDGLISFHHNGGYYSHYSDRGMIDMTGLVVKVTYSDGKSENIAYKETKTGYTVSQNILASPSADYKLGENTIEVYFKSNTKVYDSYKITLTSAGASKGDVNSDGKINSLDALMVLQHVVGISTLSSAQFNAGDMDSNGMLNSFDALLILRKSVGM